MTHEETEYFRQRERQERAAAKQACSLNARRAHQQMAERYAAILKGFVLTDPVTSLRAVGSGVARARNAATADSSLAANNALKSASHLSRDQPCRAPWTAR